MDTFEGYRPYGLTSADTIAVLTALPDDPDFMVLQAGGGAVLGIRDGGPDGAEVEDLLDETGSAITNVTVTAQGPLPRFHVPEDVEAWIGQGSSWVQLIPADVGTTAGGLTSVGIGDIEGVTGIGADLFAAGTEAAAREAIGAGVPVTLPTEIADADTDPADTATGLASGRRLASSFSKNANTSWGLRPIRYWNTSTDTWPALALPTGYTGPVIWNSDTDIDAPEPPDARDNDLWDKYVGPS